MRARGRTHALLALAPVALALLAACTDPPAAPAPAGEPLLAAFDSLWARYDAIYPYFDYKRVDWGAARAAYRPRAAAARTPDELAAVAREMLAALRDVHVSLTSPAGARVATYAPGAFVNWRAPVWSAYLRGDVGARSVGTWGHAHFGDVPYLYFTTWGTGALTLAAVDSVLEQLRDAPAMIVDVRMNGGGNDQLALGVAGRFYDRARTFGSVQYRNGPSHGDFGAPLARTAAPTGAWQFRRPVLLLTGRGAFSSNESFVMAMRLLPHVTVAGDTTGGGSGNPTSFLLAGGWSYTLPRWIERTPAGEVVEWNGLAPAVVVPAAAGDFDAGRDPVLEYAARWAAAQPVR